MIDKKALGAIIVICFILFASCTANIEGTLAADGSASLTLNMSLMQRITAMIRSIAAAGGQESANVLDGAAIARSMSGAAGITSVTLRNTSPSAVAGQIRISNINQFLSAAGSAGGRFIVFEQSTGGGRIEININRTNGPAVLETLSPEISDYLNALMAPIATGEELTKTEYLELVTSFYNKAISDEIAASRIRASIDFPGAIRNVRGGSFTGRRAVFDIPLLDLLVLEAPARYEVIWN